MLIVRAPHQGAASVLGPADGLTAESGGREIGILGGLPGLQRNQMRRNRTRSTPAHALKPNDGFQVVTGGESAAQQIGDPMTPTPSHVATDELIETLERRRTKSMAFEREFGLEGRTICPDDLDALFVTLSISEASALISALKESKRMRTELERWMIASVERPSAGGIMEPIGLWCQGCDEEAPSLAALKHKSTCVLAALQPQGEK